MNVIELGLQKQIDALTREVTELRARDNSFNLGNAINVKWYGAVNGTGTDSTSAFTAAQTAAKAADVPLFVPAGSYRVDTGTISLATDEHIIGDADGQSIIYANGSGIAIELTGGGATVKNLRVQAYTGSENAFTGIKFTAASRNVVQNMSIYNPSIGIEMNGGCYLNNLFGIYIYSCQDYGIKQVTNSGSPNGNVVIFRDMYGDQAASSVGILNVGGENIYIGGEIQRFVTGISVTAGNECRFRNIYLETNTTDVSVSAGQHYFDVHAASAAGMAISGTGEIITPANDILRYQDVSPKRSTYEDLKCLYLFDEDVGNLVHDYSANNNHGVVTGGTWASGLYGPALTIDRTASDTITIPTGVIDPTAAWSAAICFYPTTLDTFNNRVFRITDSANYFDLRIDASGGYYKIISNDGGGAETSTFNKMYHSPARWCWIVFTYDPATGIITNLDPVRGASETNTISDPISTISSIKLSDAGSVSLITFGVFALWQQVLTLAEAREFINIKRPQPFPRYTDRWPTGATTGRPGSPVTGERFFDTTLGQPVWYDGSNWIDAAGSTV